MARHLTMSTQAECPWRCKSHSTRRSLHVTQAAVHTQPASQHLTTIDRRNLVLGVAASWCTSSAAHAAPTVFEKLIITCDAGQQLTMAARAVAEWDLCVALPTAGPAACASDARSSSLRRQAAPLNRVIPILREDLPRLATNAMKRGPPKNVLGLLQNPEVNEFTWPYNVNSLRDQTDAALQELQTSAYEVLTDKAAATDPDKLNVFASSIKSARELYAKMLSA